MRRIAVLGANGQVGRALVALLGDRAVAFTREEADLLHPEKFHALLGAQPLAAVINAAAYTQVDKAESEADLAYAINAGAPGVLARWCREREIPFVHYSTDYVFPGTGERAWTEEDETAPLNLYGASKRAGEENIVAEGGKYFIFRTSWVYDATGKNFFNTMLRLGGEREQIGVVADQHGAPTYAPHLAEATLQALEHALALPEFPSDIYHLAGGGETTWHGFAEAIFAGLREKAVLLKIHTINPIASTEYPTPAQRPANSRLNCAKAKIVLGVALPEWQEGLRECIAQKCPLIPAYAKEDLSLG